MSLVRMVHPELPPEQVIEVPELAVFGRRRSGWITTDEADTRGAGAPAPTPPAASAPPEPPKPAATRRGASPISGPDKE